MQASKENPIYTVSVISGDRKYHVTGACDSIELGSTEKQIATTANITLMNAEVDGKRLSDIIKARDRVYVYADDGEKSDEVFRGFVWTGGDTYALDDLSFTIKCYDNLIYFQESEEYAFFSSGKSTKDVISSLCSKWGVGLDYDYESITHSKLVLRGALSDILMDDILDLVKERTGKKYVIRSEKDRVQIKTVGSNTIVYTIEAGSNSVQVKRSYSMDGMVTKVVILGQAENDERSPVEATISGDTDTYGTLQKLITRSENTSLADAKAEGSNIIKEKGSPTWEYEVETTDIPWIKKGDKVKIKAGAVIGTFIVKGINHDIGNKGKKMSLTLEA